MYNGLPTLCRLFFLYLSYMAKGVKPTKSKVKTDKQKRKDIQNEYHSDIPDSDRNPDAKEDFE